MWRNVAKKHLLFRSEYDEKMSNHSGDLENLVVGQEVYCYPIAWKVSKYRIISGLYFPIFGLNTGKYWPEITTYLDTFHAVPPLFLRKISNSIFLPTTKEALKQSEKHKCSARFELCQYFRELLALVSIGADFLFSWFQWEQRVEKGEEDFEEISKSIKVELARFEVSYISRTL